MELVELQIGDLGARTPCDGEAVRGGDRRIGGVRVHTACSTGGQDHPVGGQILVLPVDQQADAGDVAVPHDEIFEEGVLDDVDARVLAHHGGDVQFKHFAGGVSPGMHHAGARMSRFQAAQHVSMRVAVEVDAGRGELADALRTLTGEDVHGLRVAQAVARGHGVGGMQLRVVVGEDGRGDAALRMIGVRFHQFGLGYQGHVVSGAGHGQCRGQSGDAGAHDDDFSVAHCVAFLCFCVICSLQSATRTAPLMYEERQGRITGERAACAPVPPWLRGRCLRPR